MGARVVNKVSKIAGILVASFVAVLVISISLGMLGTLISAVIWIWKFVISWMISL